MVHSSADAWCVTDFVEGGILLLQEFYDPHEEKSGKEEKDDVEEVRLQLDCVCIL